MRIHLASVKRLALTALLLAPSLAALAWTCRPAALALWGVYTLGPIATPVAEWGDPGRALELKRKVQKHFLDARTYLPLEDIVIPQAHGNESSLLMQKACGRGRLYIWIPFKFDIPIFGKKVIEWCWKPQTRDV